MRTRNQIDDGGSGETNRSRRRFLAGAAAALGGSVLAAGCASDTDTGGASGGSGDAAEATATATATPNNVINGIRIEWGSWESDSFTVSLYGYATNVTDSAFEYVAVSGNFVDSTGTVIGSGLDNVTGLGPGQEWEFELMYMGEAEVYDFQLNDVEAY